MYVPCVQKFLILTYHYDVHIHNIPFRMCVIPFSESISVDILLPKGNHRHVVSFAHTCLVWPALVYSVGVENACMYVCMYVCTPMAFAKIHRGESTFALCVGGQVSLVDNDGWVDGELLISWL